MHTQNLPSPPPSNKRRYDTPDSTPNMLIPRPANWSSMMSPRLDLATLNRAVDLPTVLGVSEEDAEKEIDKLVKGMRAAARNFLQLDVHLQEQDPEQLQRFYVYVAERFPVLHNYERTWPAEAYINVYLYNRIYRRRLRGRNSMAEPYVPPMSRYKGEEGKPTPMKEPRTPLTQSDGPRANTAKKPRLVDVTGQQISANSPSERNRPLKAWTKPTSSVSNVLMQSTNIPDIPKQSTTSDPACSETLFEELVRESKKHLPVRETPLRSDQRETSKKPEPPSNTIDAEVAQPVNAVTVPAPAVSAPLDARPEPITNPPSTVTAIPLALLSSLHTLQILPFETYRICSEVEIMAVLNWSTPIRRAYFLMFVEDGLLSVVKCVELLRVLGEFAGAKKDEE